MHTLLSVIESSTHPDLTQLYSSLELHHTSVSSIRKAIATIKKSPPDFIVCEFFYGYGNNYAGVNISNLDVMLYTLQNKAPECKVIVLVEKPERQYVDQLTTIFPLHAILTAPIYASQVEAVLK